MRSISPISLETTRARFSFRSISVATFVAIGVFAVAVFSAGSSAAGLRSFVFGLVSNSGAVSPQSTAANPITFETESATVPAAPLSGGNLMHARTGHTATRLDDGRVLVAGGSGDTSAEIYDPANNLSVSTGNLNAARSGHTATKLNDGRILIAGGSGDSSTEIYDPASGTFGSGPAMTTARSGHTATLLANGGVLIAGGGSNTAEIFDATTFTETGAMGATRTNASAIRMNDGRIFISGGDGLNTAEMYDPASGTFSNAGNAMTMSRSRALLRVLPDGKIQIIGGNSDGSMEVYDPSIDTIGAYAHVVPESDPCANLINYVLKAETRAALIFSGSSAAERDRSGYTITELGNSALLIGGSDSSGATNTVTQFESSAATVTTDKLDYQPGDTATISGTGFAPGEIVRVMIHEDPHTPQERGFDATADSNGNFSGTYLVQDYDLNMKFIVGARGMTSGNTAQTSFTDARNMNLTFAGTGGGTVTITLLNSGTVNAPVSCGGTGTDSPGPITVNSTCAPNITFSNNIANVQFSASPNATSVFTGWSGNANLSPSTCTGTNNPCTATFTGAPALTVTFTANNKVGNVVVGAQSGSVTYGTGGSVTFPVTVTRGATAGAFNANLTVGTLPAGATASFSPNPVVFAAGDSSKTSTLTITTANTTPAVSGNSFTVTATNTALATDTTSGNGSLTVNKAALTVTADPASRFYGDANPTFTASYSGFKNGDTLATSGVTGSPSLTTTAVATTPAGSAVITAATGTLAANNYSFAFVNGTLTINKAHLTVTADNKSRAFGDPNPVFTATLSGFKNGQNLATSGVTGTASCTSAATPTSPVSGSPSAITCTIGTLAATNYDFTPFVNGNLTISQASSTTIVSCPLSVTYTGLALTPCTVSVTGAGGLSLSPTATYANNVNAGTATASYTYAGDANHMGSSDSKNFTINKANATVVVTPYSVTFDGNPHTATYTITGVNGETGAAVGTVDVSGTTHTNAGTYNNDPWSFTGAANYNNTSGTVNDAIAKAASTTTITCPVSVTYNGSAQTPCSASATGAGSLSVPVSVVYANNTNAGTATANASYAGDANHDPSTATQVTFTIDKAVANCSGIVGYTGTYNAAAHGASGVCTGVDAGGAAAGSSLDLGQQFTNVPGGTATWTFNGGTNYTDQSASVAIVINKADATCVVNGMTVTFDGNPHGATGQCTGVGGVSDVLSGLDLGSQFTNVPGGTATWAFTDVTGNYNNQGGTAGIVINKAATTTTVICSAGPFVYNGSAYTPCTASVSGPVLTMSLTVNYSNNVDAGTATASATYGESGNYLGSSDSKTFTIDKAPTLTVVTFENGPYVYRGTAFTATALVTGPGLSAPLAVNYTGDCTNVTVLDGCSASAAYVESANYLGSGDSKSITITKAAAVISVVGFNGVYDGNPHGVVSSSAIGVLNEALTGLVIGPETFTDVPGGDVTWTFTNQNYGDQSGTATVTIAKADQTITVTTNAPANAFFGASFNVAATASSGLLVSISVDGVCTGGDNDGTATITMTSGTGTCHVHYDQAGNGNYNAAPQVTQNVNAAKAATLLTVSPVIGTYGGTGVLTATLARTSVPAGFVSGKTISFTLNGNPVGSAVTDGSGTATIFPDPYLTTTGTAAGTRFDADTYATGVGASFAGDSDFALSSDDAQLLIVPLDVSASITAQEKPYDGNTSATITCTLAEPFPDDDIACTGTGTFPTKNVGTHTVTSNDLSLTGGDVGNYNLINTSASASAKIKPRTLNVSAAGIDKVYDGYNSATVTLSDDRVLNDVLTVVYASATYLDKHVGVNKPISVTGIAITGGADMNNYVLGNTTASTDADITQRAIEITATAGQFKIFGSADPVFAYSITNGSLAPLSGDAFAGALSRVGGENAGLYAITQGTLVINDGNSGLNYNLAFVSNNFEIKRADTTTVVTCPVSVVYNGAAQEPCTAAVTGPGLSQSLTVSYLNNVNAGTATASASYAQTLNYNASSDSKTFVITKAETQTVVTFEAGPYTYKGTAFTATAHVTGVAGLAEAVNPVSYSGDCVHVTMTDGCTASASYAGSDNYQPSSNSASITIVPATPTVSITFGTSPISYDANPHPASVTVTGVSADGILATPANGTVNINYAPSGPPVNTGSYTASASFLSSNANYSNASSATDAELTIEKIDASCAVNGYSGVYDAQPHGATGNCSGVAGETMPVIGTLSFGTQYTNVPGGTATWTFTGGQNYKDQTANVDIVIQKATADITVNSYSVEYDANPHGLSGSATGVNAENLSSYFTFGAPVTNVPGGSISWSFDAGGNYNTASGSATVTITKANAACTINGYGPLPYDANPHGATGSCAGVAADPSATGGSLNFGAQFTDVPGGTAHWAFTGGTNYNDQSGDAAIQITKADAAVTITDYNGVYDANPHGVSGTATGVGGSNLSAGLDLGASYTNVPGGTVNWSFTGGTNYQNESGVANVNISPADASVTVNGYSGTYDGGPHGATGSATGVNSVDLSSLIVLGDSFTNVPGGTAHWTFNAGNTNGNYVAESGSVAIDISKANANCSISGYHVTYNGNSHVATGSCTGVQSESLSGLDLSGTIHTNASSYPADPWSFTDSTGNYNNTSGTVADNIDKADASITVNGFSGIYDGSSHGATGSASGVQSENLSSLLDLGASFTDVPGGTANWTFNTLNTNGNYNSASGIANIVISQATSSTVITCPVSYVYTGSAIEPCTVAVSGAGGLNLAPAPSYSNNINVGTATASYNYAGDTNHTGSSDSKTFAITQATPIINVIGGTFVYDANGHAASATSTGVLAESVSGSFSFTYTPPGTSAAPVNVGTYSVQASFTSTDPNYSNAVGSGSITITKAPTTSTVTCPVSVMYNGFAQTPCSVSVKRNGPPAVQIAIPTPSYAANQNVGTATASYTFGGDANHLASAPASANFQITQAPLTITAFNKSKIFGNTVTFDTTTPSSDFTVATLLGSDTVASVTMSSTGAPAAAFAGSHPILISAAVGLGLANYNINYVQGTLVVGGYVFDGFKSPIENTTTNVIVWNKANGGQAIPTKWRLTLNGSPVSALSSFVALQSIEVNCNSGQSIDTDPIPDEGVAPGSSDLQYLGDGNFHFNWKTPKTYKNQCRAMWVLFLDGSKSPFAYFKFK